MAGSRVVADSARGVRPPPKPAPYKPKPEAGAFGALMAASAQVAPTLKKPSNAAAIKAAQNAAIASVKARANQSMYIPPVESNVENARLAAEAQTAPAVQAALAPKPPPVVYRTSGSGRSTNQVVSGGSGGGGLAAPPAVFVPPEAVTAPPAVVQPPAVVAEAAPSETNVPGESFTSSGTPGTFGAYQRQRLSRGPRTGLSVTPEMIRRAAAARLG